MFGSKYKALLFFALIIISLVQYSAAADSATIGVFACVEYPVGYNVGGQVDGLLTGDIVCPGQHENSWVVYEISKMNADLEEMNIETKSDRKTIIITIINLSD
ncbi:MAG TPA: hypothetical protein ENH25_01495 [candidate division Zixibacteria bacterium]|nr:hypothetical protein [candidate division Zixibacteria bacterium]